MYRLYAHLDDGLLRPEHPKLPLEPRPLPLIGRGLRRTQPVFGQLDSAKIMRDRSVARRAVVAEQFQPGAIVDQRVQRLRYDAVIAVVAIEIVHGVPIDPRIGDKRNIDPGRTSRKFGRRARF